MVLVFVFPCSLLHLQDKLSSRLVHAECEDKAAQLQAEVDEWKSYSERLDTKLKAHLDEVYSISLSCEYT